jgi:hypothetical protein
VNSPYGVHCQAGTASATLPHKSIWQPDLHVHDMTDAPRAQTCTLWSSAAAVHSGPTAVPLPAYGCRSNSPELLLCCCMLQVWPTGECYWYTTQEEQQHPEAEVALDMLNSSHSHECGTLAAVL